MGLSRWALNPLSVFTGRVYTQKQKKRCCKDEGRDWSDAAPKTGAAWNDSPQSLQRPHGPVRTSILTQWIWCWTSGLWNCESMHFYCFEPLCLWSFLTAAVQNNCNTLTLVTYPIQLVGPRIMSTCCWLATTTMTLQPSTTWVPGSLGQDPFCSPRPWCLPGSQYPGPILHTHCLTWRAIGLLRKCLEDFLNITFVLLLNPQIPQSTRSSL